jgi:hypothetical protein
LEGCILNPVWQSDGDNAILPSEPSREAGWFEHCRLPNFGWEIGEANWYIVSAL